MRILLCRHGNTFGPDQIGGEKVFISGSNNNIPLVNRGRHQARTVAQYLIKNDISPAAIYANHLIRVWEYAVIIREGIYNHTHQDIPLVYDERLLELDYGAWAGLTEAEVIREFGEQAWSEWQQQRITQNQPPHNWRISSEEMVANINALFCDLLRTYPEDATILLIGSQGSITFVNALLPGGMETAIAENRYKIKTGHLSELEYNNGWELLSWNFAP